MTRVRALDPAAAAAPEEIALVARRMHLTLVEVLGEARARALYDDAGLRASVQWHLEVEAGRRARVLLAEDAQAAILGHAFVRVEAVEGREVGLFGTLYVDPAHRRGGVASELLRAGEEWMRAQDMTEARTYTDAGNAPLQRLFEAHGYRSARVDAEWQCLSRALERPPDA